MFRDLCLMFFVLIGNLAYAHLPSAVTTTSMADSESANSFIQDLFRCREQMKIDLPAGGTNQQKIASLTKCLGPRQLSEANITSPTIRVAQRKSFKECGEKLVLHADQQGWGEVDINATFDLIERCRDGHEFPLTLDVLQPEDPADVGTAL